MSHKVTGDSHHNVLLQLLTYFPFGGLFRTVYFSRHHAPINIIVFYFYFFIFFTFLLLYLFTWTFLVLYAIFSFRYMVCERSFVYFYFTELSQVTARPLFLIINDSLLTRMVPTDWQKANMPYSKKG